jgi:hypothetical protein
MLAHISLGVPLRENLPRRVRALPLQCCRRRWVAPPAHEQLAIRRRASLCDDPLRHILPPRNITEAIERRGGRVLPRPALSVERLVVDGERAGRRVAGPFLLIVRLLAIRNLALVLANLVEAARAAA